MQPFRAYPEALLAHAGWVRELARGIVRDRAAAEDVVQETWIRALDRAPREERGLGSWLGRVASNLARERRRSERARSRREQVTARPEALPSSAETVERAELHALLV